VTDTTDTCDEYVLYESIGMIPGHFDITEVGETTRSVCRQLCSETYNQTCSGFLYNRRLQKCELSPYNGEWVTTAGLSFNSSSGLEFYRRRRCLGLIRISSFSFYIQPNVFCWIKNLNICRNRSIHGGPTDEAESREWFRGGGLSTVLIS